MSKTMLVQLTVEELEQMIARAVGSAAPSLPRYLRPGECAKWLGCTEAAIRKWCKSSGMPFVQLGKERRFEPAEVISWMRARGRPLDSSAPPVRTPSLRVIRPTRK